ncbi:hypothetical protein FQA39_LY13506 [Lamprigera yunnana]|nr:hypothetical protein FQA39_LY13506 [Lamprigera yunnana]
MNLHSILTRAVKKLVPLRNIAKIVIVSRNKTKKNWKTNTPEENVHGTIRISTSGLDITMCPTPKLFSSINTSDHLTNIFSCFLLLYSMKEMEAMNMMNVESVQDVDGTKKIRFRKDYTLFRQFVFMFALIVLILFGMCMVYVDAIYPELNMFQNSKDNGAELLYWIAFNSYMAIYMSYQICTAVELSKNGFTIYSCLFIILFYFLLNASQMHSINSTSSIAATVIGCLSAIISVAVDWCIQLKEVALTEVTSKTDVCQKPIIAFQPTKGVFKTYSIDKI